MKIAFLNIFNGIIERGSEVFVAELANELSKKYQVSVYQLGKNENKKYKEIQIKDIPIVNYQQNEYNNRFTQFFQNQLYHLSVLFFTLKCIPYILKEKPDWIIPVNGRFQVLICRILRFFLKSKILISGHAGIGFEDKVNLTIGKPDLFVALTPAAFRWAQKISPNTKIYHIPNGINLTQFSKDISPVHIELPKPIILCVSALLSYKQIELLINAVSRLKKGSLLLIGDGDLREKIRILGSLNLKERFLLIRHVSHNEIAHYYKAANVFSLPSKESEAFGLVYLEAMACNIPVVAPDDENRNAIINDAGFLCNVENSKEYVNTLRKALITDFGIKPRKQVEKFSWENISKQYSMLFLNH